MEYEPTVSELASRLPQRLAPAIDEAHRLAGLITPAAVESGLSYRLSEARRELFNATNTLSVAVNEFKRVQDLLKGFNNV